ncbi:hypothetical protein ACN47E_003586 [Coniothyrium glycines]
MFQDANTQYANGLVQSALSGVLNRVDMIDAPWVSIVAQALPPWIVSPLRGVPPYLNTRSLTNISQAHAVLSLYDDICRVTSTHLKHYKSSRSAVAIQDSASCGLNPFDAAQQAYAMRQCM